MAKAQCFLRKGCYLVFSIANHLLFCNFASPSTVATFFTPILFSSLSGSGIFLFRTALQEFCFQNQLLNHPPPSSKVKCRPLKHCLSQSRVAINRRLQVASIECKQRGIFSRIKINTFWKVL